MSLNLAETCYPESNGRYREITAKTCCFSQICGMLRMGEAAASCVRCMITMSCLHGGATIASFFPRNYGSGPEPNNFEDIMVRKSAKKKDVIKPEKTQK